MRRVRPAIKFLAVASVAAILGGCETTKTVTKTQFVPLTPPPITTSCADAKIAVPNVDTMTDAEVGHVILTMQATLSKCRQQSREIRVFFQRAKARLEKERAGD